MADGHGHSRYVKLNKDQGPCVLFGQNIETLRDDIPWTNACACHAMCIEGGMALAAATALFHGIDPRTSFLICESLFFAWWMCGIYTGLFRQSLQKKYHLKGGELDMMDGMAPLDVVVKILNNQLGSLMWIDEKVEEFSSRIQKLATQGLVADRELMGPKFWMS
ncbi:hypothetical protein LWI28_008749 [Acer negundo]|uniref:Uncharacterized protein n=1 Tax=Acer negundo TaxID=4023 RepID=A0AAD5IY85_ACENE|nr:hypothetical protein LWI28_008749 [Acer negundo]